MNGSYPSFLSENANRSFPFVENIISNEVSNDCFIDFRCWTRFKVHESPSLHLIANGVCDSLPIEYRQFLKENFCTILFLVHKVPDNEHLFNGVICVHIPLDNSQWPYLAESSLWNTSGTKMFELKTLVNQSVLQIASNSNNYLFPSDLLSTNNQFGLMIEPAQVVYSGGVVIDELSISNEDGETKTILNGDVKIFPGYNSYINQLDNKFTINTSIDDGIGKRYNDKENDVCKGIFTINGVSPDDSGFFGIEGENGIMIFSLPEDYKIVIVVDPKTKVAKCLTQQIT